MKIHLRKFINHSLAIALSAGLLTACDYLNVVPPETADMKDTMKDKQDALGFLYSAYSLVGQNHGVNSLGAHESSTDEFVNPLLWGRLGQVTSWNQLSSTTVSNNGNFQLPWVVIYDALGQVHLFEKILSETSPKEVTANDRARWNAEVKFLNAYYHSACSRVMVPYPSSTIITALLRLKTKFPAGHTSIIVWIELWSGLMRQPPCFLLLWNQRNWGEPPPQHARH